MHGANTQESKKRELSEEWYLLLRRHPLKMAISFFSRNYSRRNRIRIRLYKRSRRDAKSDGIRSEELFAWNMTLSLYLFSFSRYISFLFLYRCVCFPQRYLHWLTSPLLLRNDGSDYNSFLLSFYLSQPNIQSLFAGVDATEIQSATVLSNLITEGRVSV